MDNKNLYIYKDGEYHKTAGLDSEQVTALIKGLIGTEIKVGYYVMNEGATKYEYIGNGDIPSDFTGIAIYFADDNYIYLDAVDNGEIKYETSISSSSVTIQDYSTNEITTMGPAGIENVNFALLTHSFNELDSTIKTIIDTAISSHLTQPCTQAQWNVIKALLDKSLYLNYGGYNMIKSVTDGIGYYIFGDTSSGSGATIMLIYGDNDQTLSVEYNEV